MGELRCGLSWTRICKPCPMQPGYQERRCQPLSKEIENCDFASSWEIPISEKERTWPQKASGNPKEMQADLSPLFFIFDSKVPAIMLRMAPILFACPFCNVGSRHSATPCLSPQGFGGKTRAWMCFFPSSDMAFLLNIHSCLYYPFPELSFTSQFSLAFFSNILRLSTI